MSVGLVLAAHVAELADGAARLAGQMASDVTVLPAGGTDEGGIGTSFEKIEAAVSEADSGDGVVVLFDLGSAQLTAQMVAEMATGVKVVDAPLVEGTVAAAVSAAGGADAERVVADARAAGGPSGDGSEDESRDESAPDTTGSGEAVERTVTLPNPLGLHARPAASLSRLAAAYDATLTVRRPDGEPMDAANVISVVSAGIRGSEQLRIAARGPQAEQVAAAAADLAASGFGETEEPAEAAQAGEAEEPAEAAQAGEAEEPAGPARTSEAGAAGVLRGVSASPGIAVGPVVRLQRTALQLPDLPERDDADPTRERERFDEAVAATEAELDDRAARGGAAGAIAEAHRAFLADPQLRASVHDRLSRGAERAWWEAASEASERLAGEGRAIDLEDLALAVLSHLGVRPGFFPSPELLSGGVLAAEDMLPSQVTAVHEAGAAGLALAGSARTAHAAIIARGLGLPTALQLGADVLAVEEGRTVVLDADAGVLESDADDARVREASREADRKRERRRAEREAAAAPVPGVRVAANVGSVAEARAAVAAGADGIGLLRTEFLFLDRPDLPDEDEQERQLAAILDELAERPVTVRTLDVGGDKLLPALHLDPMRHGALGERGLRYGLRHPDLLRTQLRAILRAGQRAGYGGPVSVLAPMVTVAEEARAFARMVGEQASALGVPVPPVGVMVEVPAAALDPGPICAEVDFVSVGTNDLAQYLLAADRTLDLGPDVGRWDHPAVFVAAERLASVARAAGCPVAVCGELAGDPDAAARLVRLGAEELSVAPGSVPEVKERLRAESRDQPHWSG